MRKHHWTRKTLLPIFLNWSSMFFGHIQCGCILDDKTKIVKYTFFEIIPKACHVVPQNDQEAVLNAIKPTRLKYKSYRIILIEIYWKIYILVYMRGLVTKIEIVKYYIFEIIQILYHVVPQNDQETVLNAIKPARLKYKSYRII